VGTGFKVLVFLHILCVIGGFGALGYNALYMNLAQRRTGGGTGAVIEVNRLVSGLAEMLVYAALLFGIGAVSASHRRIGFGDAWIAAALGVYLADIAVLHAWIRPHQRSYADVVGRLEAPADPAVSRESDVAALTKLEKQVSVGWAVFNLLVVGAVYLMVFQPGR
jgi:uncharacterized membrane protein